MLEDTSTKSFFVITAKNDKGQLVFLQKILSHFAASWDPKINEYTYRFDSSKDAKISMDIQVKHFPERNRNLAAFKVKEIRPVLTIK